MNGKATGAIVAIAKLKVVTKGKRRSQTTTKVDFVHAIRVNTNPLEKVNTFRVYRAWPSRNAARSRGNQRRRLRAKVPKGERRPLVSVLGGR